MSLKALLVSSLLAVSTVATDYSSWGSSGGGGGSWGGSKGPDSGSWAAAASCPAGCQPIPTSSAPPPPASTGAGELIVQVVSVADANGSLKYFPNQIEAPIGSVVQFQFHPKNHTITESSFASPCKPLAANLTSPTRPGIKSGFVPVTGKEDFTPVYNVLINDTKPIWIFCGQTNHCQKGMAMVINQNSSSPNTIDKYIANAMQLPLANATAAPPVSSSSVASISIAPPPAPTESFTFGGAPGAVSSSSIVQAPPPAETIATPAATTTAAAQPATFTGAAVARLQAGDISSVAGLVVGAVLALW
ncbi:hypothetical protein A1O1_00196 [Capronia coronata CBS 617.96]|uniref:Phytocyanin domain-containing protein n=1 Tax=Capronia coronata CBS 617.96 TaxID=1182541 RepID=W9YR98_9EURO|nr:uncharacterized protein A1O1_00196 [Capronia coronata CBS 617.96]EXJ95078.1 hypothetical protein A1O1_00196 [Capronia coronata CBS 617.96]